MKALKLLTFSILGCLILVLIIATVIEKQYGTTFVTQALYQSYGFAALWIAVAALALAYILRVKLYRKRVVFLIHVSFLIILAGALTTRMTGKQGLLHLRKGETGSSFVCKDTRIEQSLPFTITLNSFSIVYYTGTPSPMDYISTVTLNTREAESPTGEISMNNILSYKNYRFYQSGYDEDEHGTTLAVSYDPFGIGITYCGYGLLLLSFVLFFFAPDTQFRRQLKKSSAKAPVITLFLLLSANVLAAPPSNAPKVLPKEVAAAFGDIHVLYNNRICPLQTLAKDFTTKLYGKPTYRGLTAEQVLTGWMFFYSGWKQENMIKIKNAGVRKLLEIDGRYGALTDFISDINEYKLNDLISQARHGESVAGKRSIEEADEKYNIVRFLYSGKMLKIFPCKNDTDEITWYAQGDNLPAGIEDNQWLFIKKSQDYIHEMVVKQDYDGITDLLQKIKVYQQKEAGDALPTESRFKAEKLYNSLVYTKFLAMLCVAIGLLSFVYYCVCIASGKSTRRSIVGLLNVLLLGLFIYLTTTILLRWAISNHLPLSNGYETMQFMAWCSLILAFALQKKSMFLPFGFLLCGLTLLVSMLGESNPQITQLIPVLSSPLLSLHVVVIMLAYALFAFMMLNGLAAIIIYFTGKPSGKTQIEKLQIISQLMLYPALFLLTTGIFIGAIWANVSWGRYWGWDPKEVWALITMLIYSLATHTGSLSWFSRPIFFHTFAILAFLSVLITYFGVNFILGGIHSYA